MKLNKKKFIKRMIEMTLTIALIITAFALSGDLTTKAEQLPTYDLYIVRAGDTLWDIASSYRKEGQDVRQIVYNIKIQNELNSSSIQVGQKLVVPLNNY